MRDSSLWFADSLPNCLAATIEQAGYRRDGLVHPAGGLGHREPLKMMQLYRTSLVLGQLARAWASRTSCSPLIAFSPGVESSRASQVSSRADDCSIAFSRDPAHFRLVPNELARRLGQSASEDRAEPGRQLRVALATKLAQLLVCDHATSAAQCPTGRAACATGDRFVAEPAGASNPRIVPMSVKHASASRDIAASLRRRKRECTIDRDADYIIRSSDRGSRRPKSTTGSFTQAKSTRMN